MPSQLLEPAAASALAQAPSGSDCRVYERRISGIASRCQPASSFGKDDLKWPATLDNISAGGVCLNLGRRFEPGTGLAVELPVPGTEESYVVLAKVVHVRRQPQGGWLLGCKFISELSEDEMNRLSRVHMPHAAPEGVTLQVVAPAVQVAVPAIDTPEVVGPEVVTPEIAAPAAAVAAIATSEALAPEVVKPLALAPAVVPEVVAPQIVVPEVFTPEVAASEVALPAIVIPELATPEVVKPEVVAPEVLTSEVTADKVSAPDAPAAQTAEPVTPIEDKPLDGQRVAQVQLQLEINAHTTVRCVLDRVVAPGRWPLIQGSFVTLKGKDLAGDPWKLTVRVRQCLCQYGNWRLECNLAKAPPAAELQRAIGKLIATS